MANESAAANLARDADFANRAHQWFGRRGAGVADTTWDIVVIGAGAAGLMAALRAAECGRATLLLEKNRRPGVKILMSGGTRCNITQATDNRGIVAAYGPPGKFLHSALAAFGVARPSTSSRPRGLPPRSRKPARSFP